MKNSSHSHKKWKFVDRNREETKHRTEWCAAVSKNRCMRCGRSTKQVHEHARKMYRAEVLVKEIGQREKATYGRTRYGKTNGLGSETF